jgi:hypothetical protein
MHGTPRRLIGRSAIAVITVLLVVAGTRVRSQEGDLDVLKVLPQNYKLVLDNSMVRVIEAHIPAGSVEPPHRHLRGVSVAMGDYLIEHLDDPAGKWQRSQRKLGTVYWSEAGVHQTRNVGTTDSYTIRIEMKF